jgi:thiamine biosynthesis lipoprotein
MRTTDVATADWELWSTQARICVTDAAVLPAARLIADGVLPNVDQAASRFRPDSEVSNLRVGWSTVSPTLAGLVSAALEAADLSGGAVDPTIGAAMRAIGYDRDINEIRPSRPQVLVETRVAGWQSISLEVRRLFLPLGVELDLGATAKAVAADWCAKAITNALDTGVLISLGGDIATAGVPPRGGWQVTVQDTDDDPACQVTLAAGAALATSSTVRRAWGPGLHHIVNPSTGLPSDPIWRSVSVVAPTCTEANTISTGSLVKGKEAPAWIASLGWPARLIGRLGDEVLLNGWPQGSAA